MPFKYKYWKKTAEEDRAWEDLVWRPLLSYRNHMYAKWYSHAGKTLTALAQIVFPKGNMVESTRRIQRKLAKMNKLRELQSSDALREGREPRRWS